MRYTNLSPFVVQMTDNTSAATRTVLTIIPIGPHGFPAETHTNDYF